MLMLDANTALLAHRGDTTTDPWRVSPPEVSVVLPCFGAASIARRSVDELTEFLSSSFGASWEIIIVDDGGADFADSMWPSSDRVRLIKFSRNRGKGAAVVAGMLAARGKIRVFTDVDLPYGTAALAAVYHYLRRGDFHVVIGDRNLPSSRYLSVQTPVRRLISRLSSSVIAALFTGGFFDTQCGLKGFRGDVADLIFPLVRIEGFTFDVELLYIALLHRLDVKRVPVRLERNEKSTVRVVRDSLRASKDLLRLKRHQLCGDYINHNLIQLQQKETDEAMHAIAATHPQALTW